MFRRFVLGAVILGLMMFVVGGVALADNPHGPGQTGQPSQTCQDLGNPPPTPGNSANAPGSAFNPNGNAGTNYAGTQAQNSKNPKSVAQYDEACYQQSQHQK
jgi:hypothetical protein